MKIKLEYNPKTMTRAELETALTFCTEHISALTELSEQLTQKIKEQNEVLRIAVEELGKRSKPVARTKSAEEEWTDAACAYFDLMREERGGP